MDYINSNKQYWKMVELSIIRIIGIIFIVFGGYLEYKYHPSEFDQSRFDKWCDRYRKRYPDFEQEEADEWFRNHQTGAPTELWGKDEYLKQLRRGKKFGVFFMVLGGILGIIG